MANRLEIPPLHDYSGTTGHQRGRKGSAQYERDTQTPRERTRIVQEQARYGVAGSARSCTVLMRDTGRRRWGRKASE